MRPPICAVCGSSDKVKLISFSLTKEDDKWKKRKKRVGGIGQPPWQEYFCKEHYEGASKLTHLTLPKALDELQE